MLSEQLQQAIKKLPEESQLVIEAVVVFYESQVQELKARIKELEDQISKNSRNSSKPPSTDEYDKPSPKSQREKTGRKAGGQKGHDGNNLKMVGSPDKEELHKVEVCACCQKNLRGQKADDIERRQVYDLPPLELIITEHQVVSTVTKNVPPKVMKNVPLQIVKLGLQKEGRNVWSGYATYDQSPFGAKEKPARDRSAIRGTPGRSAPAG